MRPLLHLMKTETRTCASHIDELDEESGYWAEHNVPLNGEFSDLTAQFRFRWVRDRLLASLHDLDVL